MRGSLPRERISCSKRVLECLPGSPALSVSTFFLPSDSFRPAAWLFRCNARRRGKRFASRCYLYSRGRICLCYFSFHRRMVIICQTRTGRICHHPSKILLPMPDHKICSTLLTMWPTITPRYTSIAIMLTMPALLRMSLHRHRPPYQLPCVPPSRLRAHISNQSFCRRRMSYLTAACGTPWLLELSPMNGLRGALFPISRPMKSFGSSQSSTCVSPIHKLPIFAWNLATHMESAWLSPSN